jgi:beta-N-acetylhexosaminidase
MNRRLLAFAALALVPSVAMGAPTDAQMAGQRIAWPVDGTTVSASMRAAIQRGEVGAVILFGRNTASAAALSRLTRSLQAIPRPPAVDAPILVMTDQEGGLVKRVASVPPSMSAARMGATMTPAQIRAQGAATGKGLIALGINADLAPVCDIAVRGRDIARDQRAFGAAPAKAGTDCTAFAQGLGAGGAAAAAKHFPGFGLARVNTDNAPVRITATRSQLMAQIAPFRQALGARVPMMLVSSAIYPALAPQPALLSKAVVVDLLRGTLGFKGVTVADAIDAAALKPWGGVRGASRRAAAAGIDLVLVTGTEASARQAQAAVASAMASGAVSRTDAQASLNRVLALRRHPATG